MRGTAPREGNRTLLVAAEHMLKYPNFIRKLPARFHDAFVATRGNRAARIAFGVLAGIALIPIVFVAATALYVNFSRTNLPDLEGFIRFEPPAIGHIYDANGHVLIGLGRERRDIIRYQEIPAQPARGIQKVEPE